MKNPLSHPPHYFTFLLLAFLILLLGNARSAEAISPHIVISQVYGGGGNSGATYTHDFIEIFNLGSTTVDITGWSVQYASSSGTTWQVTTLSGSIAPGQYYLIQEAQGSGGTTPLPTPNVIGTIAMSGASGKVALMSSSTALTGGCPLTSVVDFVGYGAANCFEGSAAAPGLSNTTADSRNNNGCTDTDSNVADFTSGAVNPRNSSSPLNPCVGTPPGQSLPLVENFDDCTLADWEIISVDADTVHTWSCNATFSNIEANGFGDTAPANEWLITPALNLDAQGGDTLTFRSHTSFTDINYPQVHVLYSTDYDGGGDPGTASWTELSGITFSPENSSIFTDSGEVDLTGINGTNVYFAFQYVSSGTGSGTAARWRLDAINFFERDVPTGWIINEINADPDATNGDANGDGVANTTQDEFVEIVNTTGADVNISGWTLSDGFGVRHTFPSGTVIPASCTIVVFGGGTPTGAFGFSSVQTASTGALGLNNGGDTVTLFDGVGNVASTGYGGEGGDNQSLTRDPDITGADQLVKHTTATGSGGALFSPGTLVDGSQFNGCPSERKIHEIQGNGSASPLAGATVGIEGIVVGDFQDGASGTNGDLNGFYVQEEDADADGDPLTSEGIFVFNGNSPAVNVANGDLVRVVGQVSEFNNLTEITSFTGVTVVSSGNPLPTAATVMLPVTAVSDFEAFEGMRVTFPQALSISEYFNFDRFNEVVLTYGRHYQGTAVAEPGAPANAVAAANALARITLDDGRTSQNSNPAIHPNGSPFDLTNRFRGGDTLENTTGVMDYSFGLYRIQPTAAPTYTATNLRETSPADVGGSLKVASFNVLNYFSTLDNSGPICGPVSNQDCRGADNATEFTRQRTKIIAALADINADVFGLLELENHAADAALIDLVTGLNDQVGAGTYDYVATGPIGGDAIRVALVYKSATVTLLGSYAILDSSVDPRFIDTLNRPALAQTFAQNSNGAVFTVAVNHLKSKGSDCNAVGDPDAGDGQGNCNQTRLAAAQALVDWLATDPTGSNDVDFLIIGDLNSYDKEDPIDAILAGADDTVGTNDDYTDLNASFNGEFAYSYVFDGQLGYLDYALSSSTLTPQVTGVTDWHINADEPDILDYDTSFKQPAQQALYEANAFRSSDHDPVIIGLDLQAYDYSGFLPPLSNPPTMNIVNAGQVAAVQFSLNGDLGTAVMFTGYPQSQQVDCNTLTPIGSSQLTSTPGNSSLTYDSLTDQYTYPWKTEKAWMNTCRQFVLILNDGSVHTLYIHFVK